MAKSKSEIHAEIHAVAMAEFDKIQTAMRDERLQCLQDRRFYSIAGAQWEGPLGVQFENKPRIEVNKIHMAVLRIITEYRNNRISVTFTSKEGIKDDKLAASCNSLYRADEMDSSADEAKDNAFEEAVGGGFGAFRLCSVYENDEDDEDERQRIVFEPINDADSSVFFDLNAKRQDKSDAKHCYVLTSMTIPAYKAEYNDDPASWPKQIHQRMFDWLTPDVVYVAEYYKVENRKEIVRIYQGLNGEEKRVRDIELEEDDGLRELLAATGFKEVRQKKITTKRVRKYIISGHKVLEDCGYIPGKHIPIIPVYGKRWFVDNVERCMGHVRLAKDPQRLKNMQYSKLAEISAVSSIEKPIMTPEQIAGHQVMWSEDHLKNYPFLLVNQLTDQNGNPAVIGPAAYTKSPMVPPAMAALLQLTEQDMQDVLGNQQQADKMVSNISGKAVEMIQQRLDMQTAIYMSNFAKAMKRAGEVWLSMAKELYVEEGRKMKGVTDKDVLTTVEIARPVTNDDGEMEYENSLENADFDVAVDVGPSSSSRRQATVRALTGMMQVTQDPETLSVLSAMTMMNMEGEGVEDVRDFFRQKMIKMGAVKPTEEEAQKLQAEAANMPPDPNAVYLEAAAKEANANAAKATAQTLQTVAQSKKVEAETVEILAGIGRDDRDSLVKTVQMIGDKLGQGEMPAQPGIAPTGIQPPAIG